MEADQTEVKAEFPVRPEDEATEGAEEAPKWDDLSEVAKVIASGGKHKPEASDPEPETGDEGEIGEGGIPDPDGGPESDPQPPKVSAEDYARMVPLKDGMEPVTVGQLKDFYQDNQDWQSVRGNWEDERETQRQELVQGRNELTELVKGFADRMTPEEYHAFSQRQAERVRRESMLMFKAVPEWKDNAVYQRDVGEIVEFMAGFGYSKADVMNEIDHRRVPEVLDHLRLVKKIAKLEADAKAAVEKPKPPKSRQPQRNGDGRYKPKSDKVPSTGEGKRAAVAKLLADNKLI